MISSCLIFNTFLLAWPGIQSVLTEVGHFDFRGFPAKFDRFQKSKNIVSRKFCQLSSERGRIPIGRDLADHQESEQKCAKRTTAACSKTRIFE